MAGCGMYVSCQRVCDAADPPDSPSSPPGCAEPLTCNPPDSIHLHYDVTRGPRHVAKATDRGMLRLIRAAAPNVLAHGASGSCHNPSAHGGGRGALSPSLPPVCTQHPASARLRCTVPRHTSAYMRRAEKSPTAAPEACLG